MAQTIVKLSRRYEVPGAEPFDSITLREPTYQDVFMDGLGFPREAQPNGHGGMMLITLTSTIDAYAQRLIVKPGYEAIAGLSAVDARRVQDAITDFFLEPATATTSPELPISLSSGSAGTQAASSE